MTGGCTSPACHALDQGTRDESARGAPCGHRALVINYPDCPDWLHGCTPADQQLIEAYGTCLSARPTCTPETQEAWERRVYDCAVGTTSDLSANYS
jgi:hypothetical protein